MADKAGEAVSKLLKRRQAKPADAVATPSDNNNPFPPSAPAAATAPTPAEGTLETPRLRRGRSKSTLRATQNEADAAAAAAAAVAEAAATTTRADEQQPLLAASEPPSSRESDFVALNYDPSNADAVREALDRAKHSNIDPRILYDTVTHVVPLWVHRWNDLRIYQSKQNEAMCPSLGICTQPTQSMLDAAMTDARQSIHQDASEATNLLQQVYMGVEGGLARKSSAALEVEDPTPGDPFWLHQGTAKDTCTQLNNFLHAMSDHALQASHVGSHLSEGANGEQFRPLPPAAMTVRQTLMKRVVLEGLTKSLAGDHEASRHVAATTRAIEHVPTVHADFVDAPEHPVMDPMVLQVPDMLSKPQSAHKDVVHRSYSIHIHSVRFRDAEEFTAEQHAASRLLDVFDQHRLLVANLLPNLKSRTFYQQLISPLEQSIAGMSKTNQGASQQEQQLAQAKLLLERSCDFERELLASMIQAWREVVAARESSGCVTVKLTLTFRRHGLPLPPSVSQSSSQDDLLLFAPSLTESLPQLDQRASTEEGAAPFEMFPQTPIGTAPSSRLLSLTPGLKVMVFARTSRSLPPQYVGTTEVASVNTMSLAVVNESFEMRTTHAPIEMTLHIVNQHGTVVATVRVPTSLTCSATYLKFTTGKYYSDPSTGIAREIQGFVSLSTTWTTAQGMTIEAIERMFLRGELDPLDPRNSQYVDMLRKHYEEFEDTDVRNTQYLEGEGGLFMPIVPPLTARLELLNQRWRLATGDAIADTPIEARIADLRAAVDDAEANRFVRELKKAAAAERLALLQRDMNKEYLKSKEVRHREWQDKLRSLKHMQRKKRSIKDHELLAKHLTLPPVPTFSGLFRHLGSLLSPVSNFNPKREERLDVEDIDRAKLAEKRGSSHLIVHIMKGNNLPQRDPPRDANAFSSSWIPLEPFVEATFVAASESTRAEVGTDPAWFTSLRVPFDPPDFEEDTLNFIDDNIVLNVYDKVQVDLPPAQVTLATDAHVTHFRLERRLIGTLRIPFYSLYSSDKASLEGEYVIETPRWIMGYQIPERAATLHVYVSLDPPFRKPADNATVGAAELAALSVPPSIHFLHQQVLSWKSSLTSFLKSSLSANPNLEHRKIEPFVDNSHGDPTLICRYILPGGGPGPEGTVRTVAEAIRFVSLIRFQVDSQTWGFLDVWSTNAETIALGAGDYEEMALLLVHFLRYLEPREQTFLVVGQGYIHLQATYVLHSVAGTWKLIDPRTGELFDVHNPACPMFDVGMIVSHDQIWGNMQLSGTPYRMNWNLADTSCWRPLVTPQNQHIASLIDPIQRARLQFDAPEPGLAIQLEDMIKRQLKGSLRLWRNNRPPTFQERVSTLLRSLLEEMERERRECANYAQRYVVDQHHRVQEEFASEYIPIGNPVWSPLHRGTGSATELRKVANDIAQGDTQAAEKSFLGGAPSKTDDRWSLQEAWDLTALLQAVHETMAHNVGTDDARFGLAVHCYAYTNDVVVAWVYLVALIPSTR